MTGTIVITGANGSLALSAVRLFLLEHPDYNLVLTVRNTSDDDLNTKRLRDLVSEYKNAKVTVRQLDLASLSSVNDFVEELVSEITGGSLPPLSSIVCNAYYWNLVGPTELTPDGYEKTFQVNHLAHAALVLRLLGHFGPDGGRIVLFSSDTHWPGKSPLEKYPPGIPNDVEELAKPPVHTPTDHTGRGFQKYANSKLVIAMWMYALNRRLDKDETLRRISAIAINPGNLADSRALRVNTPASIRLMSSFVIRPFLFILRRIMDPTMRTVNEAGSDVVGFATNTLHPNERGFFTLSEKDVSSPESLEEPKQEILWQKTLEWAGIGSDDTVVRVSS